MKKLIITIDTEGDNLWTWKNGDEIYTENTLFLPRFQELANLYGFKPVWLSNYEMLSDDRYVSFVAKVEEDHVGELGMHLHGWSTPPKYELNVANQAAPYLVEYPTDIIEQKIAAMTDIIKTKTGIKPITHRAGRWAMNETYFKLLAKHGYKVDCSYTPHINWKSCVGMTAGSKGSNYKNVSESPEMIETEYGKILEMPVTVQISHKIFMHPEFTLREKVSCIKRAITGKELWLRPTTNNLKEMLYLLDIIRESEFDYIMFMIHSSELMPGGSPNFKTAESIEMLYKNLDILFSTAAKNYEGSTLRDYFKNNYE